MMTVKSKVRKGDTVIVITGKDKGKTGEVFEIDLVSRKIKIRGINMVKKHRKPTQDNPGGIEQLESYIDISNVSNIDPKDNKATRVKYKIDKGNKIRISARSGEKI